MSKTKFPIISSYEKKNMSNVFRDKNKEDIVKKAVEVGYLLYPSKEYILKEYQKQTDKKDFDDLSLKSLQKNSCRNMTQTKLDIYIENCFIDEQFDEIKYLNFSNAPLAELGDIPFCQNLVILNLSNNYLVNIEPLFECVHLFRLDLQNNQLNKLPGKDFWSNLSKLKILFLHNNPIGKLEYLKNLSFSPSLEILTLYDTPLSLKTNYRHHTVNSILTLKFLDDFVVSDEEIIEEAKFNNKFSTKSQNFRINFKLIPPPSNSFETEFKVSMTLLSTVNKILSIYSPVIIIQKHIRGFLARNQYQLLKNKLENGTVKKWWRKNRENQNQRPSSSKFKSNTTIDLRPVNSPESKDFTSIKIKEDVSLKRHNSPSSTYHKRNIIVDFEKLSKNDLIDQKVNKMNLENLIDEEISKITDPNVLKRIDNTKLSLPKTNNTVINEQDIDRLIFKNDNRKKNKKRPKNISDKKNKPHKENFFNEENETEEMKKFKFRLETYDNSIIKTKDMFIVDFVKEKLYGYSLVKDLQDEAHKIINDMNENKLKENIDLADKDDFLTMDQRFFKKIYGNMNFSNLKAVDEAYHERDISDKIVMKQKKVESLREMEKISSQHKDYFKEDYLKLNHNIARRHSNLVELARIKQVQDCEKNKERVTNLRETNKKINQERRKHIMLAINFSKQHLSVSKALDKHEFLLFKEKQKNSNSNFVSQQYNRRLKQHEMVKKFIEQRKVLRNVQTQADRDLIRTRIRNDNEFVNTEAKKRVEYLKSLDYYNKYELNRNFSLPAIDMANQFKPED